jgi:hypothetical protein
VPAPSYAKFYRASILVFSDLKHLFTSWLQLSAFVSGVVLLLSLWGAKRTGTSLDPVKEMQDVRKCMMMLETAESRWPVAGRLRCVLVFLRADTGHLTSFRYSDLLTDLTTAGNLTIPAASPASHKREREDSDDDESQQQSIVIPQTTIQHQQRSSSSPYVPNVLSADVLFHRASTQLGAAAPPPAASMSSSTLAPAMFHAPSRPPPPAKENLLHIKPYQGSYIPLGGSSGLGSTPAVTTQASASSARVPTSATPFGALSSLSNTTGFATSPTTMSTNGNGTTLPEISMALGAGGGLYDMSSSSTTATTANSPQNDFYTDGVFDDHFLSGMQFGGYGVPVADREAMLRHFAPVMQDGHIGVDQDTVMMWSTMPSTFECVFLFFLGGKGVG